MSLCAFKVKSEMSDEEVQVELFRSSKNSDCPKHVSEASKSNVVKEQFFIVGVVEWDMTFSI